MFKKLSNISELQQHLSQKAGATVSPPTIMHPREESGPSLRPVPRSVVHGTTITTSYQQLLSTPPASTSPVNDAGSIHTLRVTTDATVRGRLIIIGDVHGCPDQLRLLVEKVQYDRRVDRLLIAGDLVNKGPDSVGAVKAAMELGAVALLGNHDITLLDIVEKLKNGDINPALRKHARDPVVHTAKLMPEECLEYLRRLPHIIKYPQFNVIALHAGMNLSYRLEQQTVQDITNLRRLSWNPDTHVYDSVTSNDKGQLWAQLYDGPETIVFGHDARTGLQQERHAVGLDTGCCYGGQLTAIVYPGGQLHHVPGLPINTRSHEVTPASALSPPQMVEAVAGDFPLAPAVKELFEKSRLAANATPPQPRGEKVLNGHTPAAAAAPSAAADSENANVVRLHTFTFLMENNHVLAALALLQDDGYQTAWSQALDGDVAVPGSSWGTITCGCTHYLKHCRESSADADAVMDLLIEVLNEKKSDVSDTIQFEVQKLVVQLEGGSIPGVTKGTIKSLKLALK